MDTFNRCLVFLGAAFINVAIASALEVAGPPPSTANLPPEPYAGVSPEFGSMSTVSEPSSSKAKRTISWGGVQFAPDGTAAFFLQLDGPIAVHKRSGAGTLELGLGSARAALHNHGRVLNTSFFNTPVKSARVQHRGKQTRWVFELRAPAEPEIRQLQGKDGHVFLLVSFPAK